ncbi:MAG: ATP-binding protein [Pseudomonadales bacterium]|nr:ATP-binding protein [Pseudomonadales bacterium]MDP6970812.1 ATP-binding protein [Pseudomonadales bacterium]
MASDLAHRLRVPLVEETARTYLSGRSSYTCADLLDIARAQERAERLALAKGSALIVSDTDTVVIAIWWREKYGVLPAEIESMLSRRTRRGYLLTVPDMPWDADPLREHPHERQRLHRSYLRWLRADRYPHRVLEGPPEQRLRDALRQVTRWQRAE